MSPNGRVYSILLLTSVLLGSQFPASKIVVDSMDSFSLTALRTGIGAAVGIGLIAGRGRLDLRAFQLAPSLSLGALLALVYSLLNAGLQHTTASKAALLLNASVVYVAIFMFVFFGERMTRTKAVGIALSLLGVAVLTTRLDPSFLEKGELVGDLLVFLSGLCWAVFVVVAKRVVDRTAADDWNLAASVLVPAAAISLTPLVFVPWSLPSSPLAWSALLFLGLVPTFFPLLTFVSSLRTVSPTVSALLILPAIFVAAFLSFVLLSDPFGLDSLLGGALILGGAFVATQ